MKRFSDTQKWDDPWFRKLRPEMKLLWQWFLDHCDNAGVIDVDLDLASFQIGYQYPSDTLLGFDGRVVTLPSGKMFIEKFISFQYGKLSNDCMAHRPVFSSLEKNGIERVSIGYQYPLRKGIGKGIGKEKSAREPEMESEARGTLDQLRSFAAEIGLPESDGESMFHHWQSNGWKNGSSPSKNWKSGILKWKSQGWLPSQKNPINGKSKATSAANYGI